MRLEALSLGSVSTVNALSELTLSREQSSNSQAHSTENTDSGSQQWLDCYRLEAIYTIYNWFFFSVYLYFNFIHLSFLEWNLFPHHFLTNSMLFCLFLIIMLSYLGDTICCLRCMIACSVISFLWFENFIYNYGNLSWFILVSSTIGFSKVPAHIDAKNQLVLWSLTFFVYTFTLHPNLLS